jgi:hypothetical protein
MVDEKAIVAHILFAPRLDLRTKGGDFETI